jgi:hypothetical protein
MAANSTPSQSGSETTNLETGGSAVRPAQSDADTGQATATAAPPSAAELVARLGDIRARVMPILEAVQREYTGRVRRGYPRIIDNVTRGGVFGLSLDPGYGVYVMTDGVDLHAELHATDPRWDPLSAANVEKFGGQPAIERRAVDDSWADRDFRNLIAELLNRWNYQQLRIYRVDS